MTSSIMLNRELKRRRRQRQRKRHPKKRIHAVLNFIAFHLSNVGDILRSRNSEATVSKFTKRKKKILVLRSSPPNLVLHKSNFVPSVLTYAPYGANPGNEVAINRESRYFHVVVVHLLFAIPLAVIFVAYKLSLRSWKKSLFGLLKLFLV